MRYAKIHNNLYRYKFAQSNTNDYLCENLKIIKMETKFKYGDKVRITNHKKESYIGLIGTIKEVIPCYEKREECEKDGYIGKHAIGECTSAFYRVEVNSRLINGYAMDSHIELEK